MNEEMNAELELLRVKYPDFEGDEDIPIGEYVIMLLDPSVTYTRYAISNEIVGSMRDDVESIIKKYYPSSESSD